MSPETGWVPRHLSLHKDGELRAAMPLYEKHHSWGEFVFDWAWAQAYERAGIPYYPKLVSAVPFTPAQSSRLLLRDPADADAAQALLAAALQLAADTDCSSLHVQFPMPGEFAACEEAGFFAAQKCLDHNPVPGSQAEDPQGLPVSLAQPRLRGFRRVSGDVQLA